MTGVMKSFGSDGLPSRPILRTPAFWLLAEALPARRLPAPTAPRIEATEPISFLRLKIVDAMIHLPESRFAVPRVIKTLRQSKAENITPRCDGDELFVFHSVGHGGGAKILAGIEMPQRLSRSRIHSLKRLRIIAEKHQAPGRSHRARIGMAAPNLRVTPSEGLRVEIVGKQNFLRCLTGNSFDARRIKRLSHLKLLRLQKKRLAFFERQEVHEVCSLVVRRSKPIGGAAIARANLGALG